MPKYTKTMTCLAMSSRPGGLCVAGIEINNDEYVGWIRPVGISDTHEITNNNRKYEDGSFAELLDIIQIPLQKQQPHNHQTENHQIDPDYYWKKVGTIDWDSLVELVEDYDEPLWEPTQSSTHGLNDEIFRPSSHGIKSSLVLIKPDDIRIRISNEDSGQWGIKRKIRTVFTHNDKEYILSLTDPAVEKKLKDAKIGVYSIKEAILCISLSEVYEKTGCSYLLVAALITPKRCE